MKLWQGALGVAGLLLIAVPSGLDSCAGSPPEKVFATKQMPADLRNEFLKGRIGVLRPTFRMQYLIGAFRMLSGTPLTDAEVEALYGPDESGGSDVSATWTSASGDQISPYKQISTSNTQGAYLNCYVNAFDTAERTRAELQTKWGEKDPRMLEWIRAQDQVFSNCSAKEAVIPAAPDAKMDPLLAAHRRYQIGAALLYAGQHRKAAEAFEQIAADKESPWHDIAPYLAGRALLRAGSLEGGAAAFQEGKQRLVAVAKDPAMENWHEASLALLHKWQIRVEPEVRLGELGRELMQSNEDDVKQDVIDFLALMNARRFFNAGPVDDAETTSELAAWLVAMSETPDAVDTVDWWRKTQKPAWLIAALRNAPEKALPELLRAARLVKPREPAYESVVYYAVIRETARGRAEQARTWADGALRRKLLNSTRNLILEQRMRVARNWDEFLQFSLRRPEARVMDAEEEGEFALEPTEKPVETAPTFDQDALGIFDLHLPLALWVDASGNARLPANIQIRIAEAGWVRAVLLGRLEEARKLMERIRQLQPESAKITGDFLAATDEEHARLAALFIVLRSPALEPQIDGAAILANPHDMAWGSRSCWSYPESRPADLGFLSAEQRTAGNADWKQIRKTDPWNATYLARQTVQWARKYPDDPRVPEALHRAVIATRFRCTDADTGKYSQQAFALLHRKYPKSRWAGETPYWYQ
jgi:hypothetical protein